MIEGTLKAMREALNEEDIRAKRDLLSKVVAKIVTGPTGADLSHTFALHEMTEMHTVPPRGHSILYKSSLSIYSDSAWLG